MPEAGVCVAEFHLNPSPKPGFCFFKSMPQPSSDNLQCVYRFVHQRHVRTVNHMSQCMY